MRTSFTLAVCLTATAAHGFTADELWQTWSDSRWVTTAAPCLLPAELQESMATLAEQSGGQVKLEVVGASALGRPIRMLQVGTGERNVLLWSQMHGDEPSATPALLDLTHYLLEHANEPAPRTILDELTLLMIPMLNPDGSELYVRRNAQAIDINRDALNRSTPEGQILERVRDRYQPILGFNLHDQNRRKTVGDSGVLSTNSVLAVAGDEAGTMTPGRWRAKRACAAIVEALAPFMPGGMARYDEDWSPRAFGDNITAWGTPVVLIESGGLPVGYELTELTRINFVALLMTLQELARDDLAAYDPQVYEDLPRTADSSWADVVLRNGYLLQPGIAEPYRADLSLLLLESDRQRAGCAVEESTGSLIFEIGDNRFIGAGREIDGSGTLVVAPFDVGIEGWSARKWLDRETLARLTRLGVGTVRWRVKESKQTAAERIARSLERQGSIAVVVVSEAAPAAIAMLERPPSAGSVESVGRLLEVLGVGVSAADPSDVSSAVQRLWLPSATETLPALRQGRPASFVVLGPAPEGQIDLEHTRLQSIWVDGIEIHPRHHAGD